MVFELDDVIPFCNRKEHVGRTIRQIIRYDSGYLKDLFVKNENVIFSEECMLELKRLTKGHFDNWEKPKNATKNFWQSIRLYVSPYLYDFNDEIIENINKERLSNV